ncbi:MAG: ATP synthase F1 subunit epsilon [Candidatus Eiseniibacteriota bacterium]|nr:MAG: ATP synthase F1 subunit epsilon [Candidatus Eisenbacteria bacterium]
MAMNPFRLRILTLEESFYEGDVDSLIAPGADGYFGVLAHHAPMLAALRPGKLLVRERDSIENVYAVSGGFLEVSDNSVTLLADAIESAADIDLTRAEQAKQRALERISSRRGDVDIARAEAALTRALNRVAVYHSWTSG